MLIGTPLKVFFCHCLDKEGREGRNSAIKILNK